MSPRKSAAPAAVSRELIRALLRDGRRRVAPGREVVEAAEWLARQGIAELRWALLVRCANPDDADFPPVVRECDGLIAVRGAAADERGGDYRCPRCERIVYPEAGDKQPFNALTVLLRREGIEAFIIARLADLASGRPFRRGVLTMPVEGLNASVCLVDYCNDEDWLRRGTALAQPVVYVTVEPDAAVRMLRDEAIAHVELADVLVGAIDLERIVIERAGRVPAALSNVDVPVYTLSIMPGAPQPQQRPGPRRTFHVWLSPAGLRVEGLLAIRATRTTAILIMRALIQRFTEALAAGEPVEPMSADDLADAVQEGTGAIHGADTIRRRISGMRKDIAETVRRHTGAAIGEHDVIETVSRSGAEKDAEGYRLNPATVALGPPEA